MTWIKETDSAFYLMDGGYYLEKIVKVPRPNGEKELTLIAMKDWFMREDAPGQMVVAVGVPGTEEPQQKPEGGSGHDGTGSGNVQPKPRVTLIPANPSNYRARRSGFKIDTIVMHNTVYSAQSAINRFTSPTSEVSAHYIVARSGEIFQLVQDRDCAFHAGNRDVNDRSIGIEHEATQAVQGFTPVQEQASIALIKFLLTSYDIPKEQIIPHRRIKQTACPSLIFPTDQALTQWIQRNF